jgi:hypothetical protein
MVALISNYLRFWLQFIRKNRHWFKPMFFFKKPSGLNHGLSQRGLNQTTLLSSNIWTPYDAKVLRTPSSTSSRTPVRQQQRRVSVS